MNLKTILFLVMISIFASCGENRKRDLTNLRNYAEIQNYITNLDNQTVTCGSTDLDCPNYIAKVTYWGKDSAKKYYIKSCSGTLVQDKYVITNSHCIPPELKKTGSDCIDKIKVFFPKTKTFAAESIRCSKVIQAFDQNEKLPDMAVIELESSLTRGSVAIARTSFVDSMPISLYEMEPSTTNPDAGVLVKKECNLSINNALYMTTSTSAPRGLISAGEAGPCLLLKANFGSAILSDGKMIGVLHSQMTDVDLKKLFADKINYIAGASTFGMVQNIGCLKNITTSGDSGCALVAPTSDQLSTYITTARAEQVPTDPTLDESKIYYGVSMNLKLSLSLVDGVIPVINPNTLNLFRQNWPGLL